MSIVLLGAGGFQGKAALYDLSQSSGMPDIIAADIHPKVVETYIKEWSTPNQIRIASVDADDEHNLSALLDQAEFIINLLPSKYAFAVADLAVARKVNLVDSGYLVDPGTLSEPTTKAILEKLNERAKKAGVTILRECGMDPGIDLLMCGEAVRELDEVHELISYGSGFPEAETSNNPLRYKISWTFEGVLKAYKRAGRYMKNGQIIEFSDTEMFSPSHTFTVNLPPFGDLEAYPNGDALAYADELGIREKVDSIGRFVLRWPGHLSFWYKMAQLHFLDETPIQVGNVKVSPRAFMVALLEPQLQYGSKERDAVFIHIEVRGIKKGKGTHLIYELIDKRDLKTGLMAMQRTVGFAASIGAQMILRGDIHRKGLLSPLNDVPYEIFEKELRRRNIKITRWEKDV
jgi:lysine 6-dehydrogenase